MSEKLLSRREFLAGSGGFAAGAAVGSMLSGGLLTLAAEKDAPVWPWPYSKLDPEAARKLGYELYYQGG